jgi:hypothetical protein
MTNVYYPLGAPCDDMSEGEYQRQYYGPEDLDGWEEEGPLDAPYGFWVTSGNQRVVIRRMTTDHLRNAIAYEERTGNGSHPKVDELREELAKR